MADDYYKKCTFVKMTSEHSKRILSERIVKKKILTEKIVKDRDKRKREWQKWWR